MIQKTIRTIKEAQAEKEPTVQARRSLADFLTGLETAKNKQDEYLERKLNLEKLILSSMSEGRFEEISKLRRQSYRVEYLEYLLRRLRNEN